MSMAPAAPTVARSAGVVAAVTVVARVVGFARWLVFAATVGAAGVGGVYQSVNTVPNVVYEVAAGGVLAAVVVPLVAERVRAVAATGQAVPSGPSGQSGQSADEVAGALLTRAVVVLLPVSVLVAVCAPFISRGLLGDLGSSDAVDLGTRLLVLFSPQVLLYGVGVVVSGVLQAHERFAAAALAPLLSSVVVIATYLLYGALVPPATAPGELSRTGWLVLGAGTTLGVVALSLPLLLVAEAAGIRLRPRWRLAPRTATRARDLAGAGLIALLAQQLAVLVTVKVANRSGGDGVVVVQGYVQALYLLPYAVLAVPVATAAFPRMARVGQDAPGAARTAGAALRAVVLLGGAAAAALVVVAEPVGTVFAALGRSRQDVVVAALPSGLAASAPGLVGLAVAAVATRALYARGRAVAAGLAVASGWLVAALLPVLLLGPDEGAGRTLAVVGGSSSLGLTLAAVALLLLLRCDWATTLDRRLARAAAVTLVAVGAAAVLHLLAADRWPGSGVGALAAGALVGVVVLAGVLVAAAALDPTLRTWLADRARRATRAGRR